MSAQWFSIHSVETWGDYWHVLVAGMTRYMPRMEGKLRLLRTAPFVPPMAVSGMDDLIVTETFRSVLTTTPGIAGFLPVIKEKIVWLDWSSWVLSGDEPRLSRFNEPEDCVLAGQHDERLSSDIGELYEVLLESDGMVEEYFSPEGDLMARILEMPRRGYTLFKAKTAGGGGVILGTKTFVASLPRDAIRWLEFTPVVAAPPQIAVT